MKILSRLTRRRGLFEMGACGAAFGLLWAAQTSVASAPANAIVSAVSTWTVTAALRRRTLAGWLSSFLEQFLAATGVTFAVQFGTAYVLQWAPLPWWGTLAAVLGATLASTLLPGVFGAGRTESVLLVNFGQAAKPFARSLGSRLIGVLDEDPSRVPAEAPFLGGPDRLREAVLERRPDTVVFGHMPPGVSPMAAIAGIHAAGATVRSGPALYENLFERVRWMALDPLDLVSTDFSRRNRFGGAVLAVYTNVIGLALLVLTSPVLLAAAIAVALLAGRGPVLESVECFGQHKVPFRALRFRTLRANGSPCWIGSALERFNLANLPQLLNVVRGEMTLFGPIPVRREFAAKLSELLPAYDCRFTAKPGMTGWTQVNLGNSCGEADRLEYDLYYIKHQRMAFDFQILLLTLFRSGAERAGAASIGEDARGYSC